jgi:hypothetical protein
MAQGPDRLSSAPLLPSVGGEETGMATAGVPPSPELEPLKIPSSTSRTTAPLVQQSSQDSAAGAAGGKVNREYLVPS